MKKAIAELMVNAGQENGIDCKLYEDYSGRHMYGKKTDAIQYNNTKDLLIMAAMAMQKIIVDGEFVEELPVEEEFVEELGSLNFDNLGRQEICY